MRYRFSSLVLLFSFMLGTSLFSNAQIFRVQGGVSSLFGADGASIDIKAPDYDGQIGAGFLNGHFQYGFLARTNFFGNTLSVGDDTVKVELPTDVFDASHYFLARGVGLQHFDPKTKDMWYAFAGTTSLGYSTPFFMASRSDAGLGILYFEHRLSKRVRFVSRNLFSDQQTSIQGVEWTAADGVKISASAGMGSNQPYMATALRVDRERFALRAAYIAEGANFQRMQVPSPISTEPEKANILGMYRITRHWTVRGSHQNILQPAIANEPLLRATVDEAYTNVNVAKFDFGAGAISSRSVSFSHVNNVGLNFYVGRQLNRVVSVTSNFYQSRPSQGSTSNTFTTLVREQLTQKLAVTQNFIRSNGQNTVTFGGEYVANRFNISVGYQTVYVPFNPINPFQQALNFNAKVNLPHNLQLTAGSFVDPQGKVRYTLGIGTYLYRLAGMAGPGATPQSFRFPKYVVEGIVVDGSDQPLEGAAIKIDGKEGYSDSDGRFMIRLDKPGPFPVTVVLDEFTAPGMWEVLEAPASATGVQESDATPIKIVVRRVPLSKKNVSPISTTASL